MKFSIISKKTGLKVIEFDINENEHPEEKALEVLGFFIIPENQTLNPESEMKTTQQENEFVKYVLVEFENSEPFVQKFTSKKEINFKDIIKHYVENEEFDESKDYLTEINNPENLPIVF